MNAQFAEQVFGGFRSLLARLLGLLLDRPSELNLQNPFVLRRRLQPCYHPIIRTK